MDAMALGVGGGWRGSLGEARRAELVEIREMVHGEPSPASITWGAVLRFSFGCGVLGHVPGSGWDVPVGRAPLSVLLDRGALGHMPAVVCVRVREGVRDGGARGGLGCRF